MTRFRRSKRHVTPTGGIEPHTTALLPVDAHGDLGGLYRVDPDDHVYLIGLQGRPQERDPILAAPSACRTFDRLEPVPAESEHPDVVRPHDKSTAHLTGVEGILIRL